MSKQVMEMALKVINKGRLVTIDEAHEAAEALENAIKQHDAEPVGEVVAQGENVSTARLCGSSPQGTKVYTSAPSVSEGWQPIETLKQSDGAVILYSEDWVDEDFNPTGTREGFRNESDTGPIYSAAWNPCQDCWDTDEDSKPSHWCRFSRPPKGE